jgi:hypothetical protein
MHDFTPEQQEYKEILHGWFAAELCALDRARNEFAPPGTLLLGAGAWQGRGGDYIERLWTYAVPTLHAPKNAAALRGRAHLVLFTDAPGYDRVWRQARALGEMLGRPPQIFVIPPAIMDYIPKHADNVNPLLGAFQSLTVQIAGRYGMAYHPLFPDHLYCDGYFPSLFSLARHHSALVQTSVSASMAAVRPELEGYRRGGAFAIPALDLGDMGFRHLHGQSLGNLMNRGTTDLGYPTSYCSIWQGRDKLYAHCCHLNAAYLSPGLCAAAPVRYFSPLDCNLPHLIPGAHFHVPTAKEGMTFIELSTDQKFASTKRVDEELHAAICWHHTKFRDDFLPYFAVASEVPIKRQESYLEEADIRRRHAEMIEGMKRFKHIVRDRIQFEGGVARYKQAA